MLKSLFDNKFSHYFAIARNVILNTEIFLPNQNNMITKRRVLQFLLTVLLPLKGSSILLFPLQGKPPFQKLGPEAPEMCCILSQDRLQVAFVLDRTNSYKLFGKAFGEKVLPRLFDSLQDFFPQSQFAITTFADYSQSQGPIQVETPKAGRPDSIAGCYFLKKPFTTSKPEIVKAFNQVNYVQAGFAESSVTALMFTSAEKRLNWITPTSSDPMVRPKLFKILVLLTDQVSTRKLKTDANRRDPLGDGTDTCRNSKIPDDDFMKKILTEKGIKVVAVLRESGNRPKLAEEWAQTLTAFGVPASIVLWNKVNETESVMERIVQGIMATMGEECEMTDPQAANTLGL